MRLICGTTVAEKKVKQEKEDKVREVCYLCFILLSNGYSFLSFTFLAEKNILTVVFFFFGLIFLFTVYLGK